MKILIINSYFEKKSINFFDIFYLYANNFINYLKYLKYISKNEDLQIIKKSTMPKYFSNIKKTNYSNEKVDIIMLFEKYGFKNENYNLLKNLRSNNKCPIITVSFNNKYLYGEDFNFSLYQNNQPFSRNKSIQLGFMSNPQLCTSNKDKEKIVILLQIFSNPINKIEFESINKRINNFILKYKNKFEIDKIIIQSSKNYDVFLKLDENLKIIQKLNILELYKIYSYINISFILNYNLEGSNFLFDMAMSNICIVTLENSINKKILDLLEIFYFEKRIMWSKLFDNIKNINTRQKLIENKYTEDDRYEYIYEYLLKNYKTKTLDKKTSTDQYINNNENDNSFRKDRKREKKERQTMMQ